MKKTLLKSLLLAPILAMSLTSCDFLDTLNGVVLDETMGDGASKIANYIRSNPYEDNKDLTLMSVTNNEQENTLMTAFLGINEEAKLFYSSLILLNQGFTFNFTAFYVSVSPLSQGILKIEDEDKYEIFDYRYEINLENHAPTTYKLTEIVKDEFPEDYDRSAIAEIASTMISGTFSLTAAFLSAKELPYAF